MDLKESLNQHYEKLILGGVVMGALALVFTQGLARDEGDALYEQIRGHKQQIQARLNDPKNSPKKAPEPAYRKDAETQLTYVPDPGPFGRWAFYQRPFVHRIVDIPKPTDYKFAHAAPAMDEPRIDFGEVRLSWGPGRISEKTVEITGWDLYRRDTPEGEWRLIEKGLGAEVMSYTDANVQSRARYWYKVISHAKSLKDGYPLPQGDEAPPTRESEALESPTLPRDVAVKVASCKAGDIIDDIPGEATLYVYKWGMKPKYYPSVKEGEMIGSLEETTTLSGDAKDYRTGFRLEKVRIYTVPKKIGDTTIDETVYEIEVVEVFADETISEPFVYKSHEPDPLVVKMDELKRR